MKKIKLILICISMMCSATAQKRLTFQEISTATSRPPTPEIYLSFDSTEYKVGDTLTMGVPSGTNGNWVYITSSSWASALNGTPSPPVPKSAIHSRVIIKSLSVSGTKRSGFKLSILTKGNGSGSNYGFCIEDAIEAGEISPKNGSISSDKAIEMLKKEKDKLELVKFIK